MGGLVQGAMSGRRRKITPGVMKLLEVAALNRENEVGLLSRSYASPCDGGSK